MNITPKFDFNNDLIRLAELFRERGATLFVVGGHVRNTILGKRISDTDITSRLRPDEVLELCERAGFKTVPKGIAFGMVEIHIGDGAYEHTTFRSD
ncbi:MAG: CCA tRNA nucleotidyltransferase, partial [Clostridia bacterium]|nr:CCA tRNA nucleotidyltransferase [Clostridia bacterium]